MGKKSTKKDDNIKKENVKDIEKDNLHEDLQEDKTLDSKDEGKKDKDDNQTKENKVNHKDKVNEEEVENKEDENVTTNEKAAIRVYEKKIDELQTKLEETEKKSDEHFRLLQLKVAEFDNFKKRTIKEKDEIYKRSYSEAIGLFMPLIDNFDRAIAAMSKEDSDKESIREGVEMIYKQLKDIFKNAGIEEIKAVGEIFDPNYHNAVMHIEDDNYKEQEVVEEFQKGFVYKDIVIRHSVVKVAN